MAKYIDADKLIVEIERHIKHYESSNRDDFKNGELYICQELLSFIDSLQQEQPEMNLEKEIVRFLSNSTKMNKGEWRGKYAISDIGFRAVAHHFFELGQRKAAEMYDEIEYNRQRAEEEMSNKTLDEAAVDYANGFAKDGISHELYKMTFVAGAKWMAEQGVSWEDKMTYYDGFLLYGKDERAFTMGENFNEGDKVIVQIRKK